MGPGGFFSTNPDLADILGDTDFYFDSFHVLDFFGPMMAHDRGLHSCLWENLSNTFRNLTSKLDDWKSIVLQMPE